MPKRTNVAARFAGALILALGFLAPGARIPVFQEDPVAEVGRAHAADRLSVVTTTQDLASIASEVGGDRVAVESLTKGYQDPHFVDAKPSYLLKLRKADLFVEVGRDLEVGWVPGLLQSARNRRILPGGPGFVDASEGVAILESGGRVGREQGDVHPLGNPHYWLNPENGLVVAANLRDALSRARPADASYFAERYRSFEGRLRAKLEAWKKRAAEFGVTGAKAATYHRSWTYFAEAFGITVVGYVEPRPGVPPPPRHVQELSARMKSEGARLLIVEPYFDPKLPERIAAGAGAEMVVLPPSVGAVPEAADYLTLFDVQLRLLHDALHGNAP